MFIWNETTKDKSCYDIINNELIKTLSPTSARTTIVEHSIISGSVDTSLHTDVHSGQEPRRGQERGDQGHAKSDGEDDEPGEHDSAL